MSKDQASSLRQRFPQSLSGSAAPAMSADPFAGRDRSKVRSLSFTSGKGGVGKTNLVINLGVQLARAGKSVLLVDADLGLANIDIMLNLIAEHTIEDVLTGRKEVNEIVLKGPEGMDVLPASSGVSEMSELTGDQQMALLRVLGGLEKDYDYILIDTGAGIASSVLRFNAAADEICVVTNTEPTAMTDAYALMKVMATKYRIRGFNLIVNQATLAEAQQVHQKLVTVFEQFLPVNLVFSGFVPRDPGFSKAVRQQKPLTLIQPNSPTAKAIRLMAKHLDSHPGRDFQPEKGSFWQRLGAWKKVR